MFWGVGVQCSLYKVRKNKGEKLLLISIFNEISRIAEVSYFLIYCGAYYFVLFYLRVTN